MKKLFIAALAFAAITINAQKTATANVSIILHDVISITVDDPTVVLEYRTPENYQDGVTLKKDNHLKAFSTSPYNIRSKVEQDNLITQSDISLNGVLQTRIIIRLSILTKLVITYIA